MAAPFAPNDEKSAIDHDYDDKFNRADELRQLEQLQSIRDNHPDAISAREGLNSTPDNNIQSQEESPTFSGPWADKTTPQESRPRKEGWKGMMATAKKRGPLGIILTVLIAGAVGVSFLTPGLLLLHVTETITDKLNMQFPSMDIRTNKVLTKKISNQALSGVCTQKVTVRCKFNSLNDRQLKSLRDAGITIELQENTTITGRHKPVGMKFGDKVLDPANLSKQLQEDPELRSAFKRAYNSKFAGYADKVWTAAAGRLKISKGAPFRPGISDKERTEAVKTQTKEGRSTDSSGGRKYTKNDKGEWVYEDDPNTRVTDANGNYIGDLTDAEGNSIGDQIAKTNNDAIDNANPLKNGIDEIASKGEKSTGKVLAAAQESLEHPERNIDVKGLTGTVLNGVAAAPDAACSFYGMYRTVSFGAKTIRSGQMARYAMMFLTISSMIRSGEASPEDVAYLAGLLTMTVAEEVKDRSGKITRVTTKAATDSYGYNYVAGYNKGGPLTASAAEFTAGGGLGGKMNGIANQILSALPGVDGQKDTVRLCGVIKSPLGQAANVVINIGLLIFGGPVGWGTVAAGIGGGIAMQVAMSTAQTILTPILADMVAGVLVDNSTFGEKAGDALVSGSGVIMSTVAGLGGNAPLKPEEAVAYTSTQHEVLARYAEEERLAHSPLDPTSPYTFMGRIVGQLVPYSSQTKTLSSIASTSLSVAKRSLATIFMPAAFAAENTATSFTQCDDIDYREINLATDPYCNPIRGIPPQYLDVDPNTVLDYLIENQIIDEDSGQPKADSALGKKYKEFIDDCINRTRPLGDSGDEFNLDNGEKCFIQDDSEGGVSAGLKAYWYIYHMDQRIIDGMENGYDIKAPNCGPSGGGAQISESELKAAMKDYGLPEPSADGNSGYTALLEGLKSNPKASWATQSFLAGEKIAKTKGFNVKEYLNTAWVWFETGSWADPYEVNCNDAEFGTSVSDHCGGGLIQVAGYQGFDRKNDYVEVFKKLYSENQLGSVLKGVVDNSTQTIDSWSYVNPTQKAALSSYVNLDDLGSVTLSDISPNKDIYDTKTQILTFMLGKDPTMAAALNSFAVSDGDVIAMLRDCTSLSWSNNAYYCDPDLRQKMANLIMALYLFDSQGGSSSTGSVNSSVGSTGANQPTAEGINTLIERSEKTNNRTSPLHGKGDKFIEFGSKYGINPGVVAAILLRETQLATDGSSLYDPPFNNIGGNTAAPPDAVGTCGYGDWGGRAYKKFCNIDDSIEGVFKNLDMDQYRSTNGTVAAVMEVYSPSTDGNDNGTQMYEIFGTAAEVLGITIKADTPLYASSVTPNRAECAAAAVGYAAGKGIAALWGGTSKDEKKLGYGLGADVGLNYYKYGITMGLGGTGSKHTGVDVPGKIGDPIYAPVNGVIVCSGTDKGEPGPDGTGCEAFNDYLGQGNGRIQITTDNGDIVILGHTSTSTVQVGQRVTLGQQVGTVGGMNGPHTHLEVRVKDATLGWRLVDPIQYLGGF